VRAARTAVGLLAFLAGAALLVWYAGRIGRDAILSGLTAVGAGFLGVLLISLLRFVARTAAWIALIPARVPVGRAVAASIGGDAIGSLTPLAVLVGEPAKALYLQRAVGISGTLPPLAAENFFYGISIAIYVLLGSAAMLTAFALPDAVRLAGISAFSGMAVGLAVAAWLAWRRPSVIGAVVSAMPFGRLRAAVARLREFEQATYGSAIAPGARLGRVALAQAAFHILSFLEAWFTLWLLTGASRPLEAFVLDAFGRVSNVIFRVVPLRLGVDQAGAGLVAQAIGLDPATGVALSLVRTARLLFWTVAGLAFVAARVRK
jgi:hypothetical protein